jgi:hypothetical protein
LCNYADNLRTDQSPLIASALLNYISNRFSDLDPSIIIANMLENQLNGWRIEPNSQQDHDRLMIATEGSGISLANLVELIETFLPEALGQRMVYEPLVNRRPSEFDFYLH